jgi:hypothetical protein
MIRDFYQLVEDDNGWKNLPKNLRRFKWLRDVLSHKGTKAPHAIGQVMNSFKPSSAMYSGINLILGAISTFG